MSRDHIHIFCSACRSVIMCPIIRAWGVEDTYQEPPAPWVHVEPDYFCSAECQTKGPAEPVRERSNVQHIRMPRDLNPNQRRGFNDAILGYDCISSHPHYVKGHRDGMNVRDVIDKAVEHLESGRKP